MDELFLMKIMKDFRKELDSIEVTLDSFECSITTDIAVFGFVDDTLKVLMTLRSVGNYENHWMLPGGAMERKETLEDCTSKVLFALMGFKNIHFEQVGAYGAIDRHPLKRVVTVCFFALVKPENHPIVVKGKVANVDWFPVDQLPCNIGFDHALLIKDATASLKRNIENRLILRELLPEKFTLTELQVLHERILGMPLDKRNFRKRIFLKDILTSTEEKKIGIKGGPLLYTFKKDV